MKYEIFTKLIELLKDYQIKEDILYKNGVDLYNANEPLQLTISMLLGSIYGVECLDTFDWWCYENDWGTKGLTMTDKDGNLLFQTIEELHQYLEENKTDDYEIKKPLSQEEFEERMNSLKNIFDN